MVNPPSQLGSTLVDEDAPRTEFGQSVGWVVSLNNTSADTNSYTVQAVCVPVSD